MSWPPTIKEMYEDIDEVLEHLKGAEYPTSLNKQGTVYTRIYTTSTGRRMSITITDYDNYLENKPEDPWYGQY